MRRLPFQHPGSWDPIRLTNFPFLLSSGWQSCNPFIGSIPPLTRTLTVCSSRLFPLRGCRLKVLLDKFERNQALASCKTTESMRRTLHYVGVTKLGVPIP